MKEQHEPTEKTSLALRECICIKQKKPCYPEHINNKELLWINKKAT